MFETALCKDCGIDTWAREVNEFYMVTNATWMEATGEPGLACEEWIEDLDDDAYEKYVDEMERLNTRGLYLCVDCLEKRLKRRLTPLDFIDAPINHNPVSGKLRERMGMSDDQRT